MRKVIFLALLAVVIGFSACKKDQPSNENPATSSFEFKIEQANFFKGSDSDVPECLDLSMDYAVFDLGGVTYTTDIYSVEGEMLTEVIKLPVGNYELTNFLVYNDNNTPNDTTDDILVKASPAPGSEYWDLMENQLNLNVTVDAFTKNKLLLTYFVLNLYIMKISVSLGSNLTIFKLKENVSLATSVPDILQISKVVYMHNNQKVSKWICPLFSK